MSHLVRLETKLYDPQAVTATCQRLQLPAPVHGTARFYSAEVTGLLVQLPEWRYPLAIDTLSGVVHYDDYQGAWGDVRQLHRFVQNYVVEKVKIEAHKRGYRVHEQPLENGSIKLQVMEHA